MPKPKTQQKNTRRLPAMLARSEMQSFWVFVFLTLFILVLGGIYWPIIWTLAVAAIMITLVPIVFYSGAGSIKKVDRAVAVSAQFERIVNSLPDGVVVYDADFNVMVFNPAAERVFGISKSEILGTKLGPEKAQDPKLKLLSQTVFPSLAPLVVPRSQAGEVPQVTDISFNDPEMEIRVATAPIPIGGSTGFVKVITDRTREAEIYRSKAEFITIAAHQLQTPITTTYWALDVLRKDTNIPEELRNIARDGYGASVNLSKIVNDLLDVAKIEEGKFGYNFQQVDIIAFIKEILKNANVVAKSAGVNMYLDPGAEASVVLNVDPDRLAMAISNLIDNAIKYNLKNGSVTVRVARLPDKPYMQISVTDTGIGIPEEDMDKIFKKFYRAENAAKIKTEGTGLGLYITKNIIRRHGGNISVNSIVGRGSTFSFILPTDPRLIPRKEMPYEE